MKSVQRYKSLCCYYYTVLFLLLLLSHVSRVGARSTCRCAGTQADVDTVNTLSTSQQGKTNNIADGD